MRRIKTARRRYMWETVDVSGAGSLNDVAEKIDARIREKKYTDDTLLRVTLTGAVSP